MCTSGHKLRDLGPSLTYVMLCKVLWFPCMSNVDSYVIPHSQIGTFLSGMPTIAYQVMEKVLKFSLLNEKLTVCSSEYHFHTFVQ